MEKEFLRWIYIYTPSRWLLYHWHSWVCRECAFTKKGRRRKKPLKEYTNLPIDTHMDIGYRRVYLLFKTTPNFTLNNFQFAIDIQKQTIKFMYSRRPFFHTDFRCCVSRGYTLTLWYLLSYHRFFLLLFRFNFCTLCNSRCKSSCTNTHIYLLVQCKR